MAQWTCDGVPKNGQQYPGSEPHEPHLNYGTDCEICGLPQEAMISPPRQLPLKPILGVIGILALGIPLFLVVGNLIGDRCPSGTSKVNQECIDSYLDVHAQGVKNGNSALEIIKRYRSVADLEQAQQYLNLAITDLSSIPESSSVYPEAQTKISEYDELAVQVSNVINNFQLCAIEPKPDDCRF